MKLQQNTLLALYSVLEFAARPDERVSAAEVAAKFRVSPHHLAKVLRVLGRAGLVRAARGVGGGYVFGGNTRRVTLMDVIGLFEDIGQGSGSRTAHHAARADAAVSAPELEAALGVVLTEIDEIAVATFRSITLDTMLKLARRRRQG